ncbi:MAG TPA: DNA-3-methyladenine glycosylase [Vicinamibacterales bacterium]|nr:DNA-3-methyladenine glycosylase [Vicinamibacterales bacterium]
MSRRRILPPSFFARPTLTVARELVGALLVHDAPEGCTAGRIVEVEAYIGESDPACHAAAGVTARTAPLYGPPGRAYVYLNYGMHLLLNAVTEAEGQPAAVLLRALVPVEGEAVMRARRFGVTGTAHETAGICRGPGNLARAMGITMAANRASLSEGPLTIQRDGAPALEVVWTPRVGVSAGAAWAWRCVVRDEPAVSGRRQWVKAGQSAPAPPAPRDLIRRRS